MPFFPDSLHNTFHHYDKQLAGMFMMYMYAFMWCTHSSEFRGQRKTLVVLLVLTLLWQGPSLNLEQGWWPRCTSEPPVSIPSSTGLTTMCVATPRFLDGYCRFELKSSCFHSNVLTYWDISSVHFNEFLIGLFHVNYQISGKVGASKMIQWIKQFHLNLMA